MEAIGTHMRTSCASHLASPHMSDQTKYGMIICQCHILWCDVMLRADDVFRLSAIEAILCHKGYDMEQVLSQISRLSDYACLGLRDMALTQQC